MRCLQETSSCITGEGMNAEYSFLVMLRIVFVFFKVVDADLPCVLPLKRGFTE